MRVLFSLDQPYLPQHIGGTELAIHEMCLALEKRGVQTAVLANLGTNGIIYAINRFRSKVNSTRDFPEDHCMGYPAYRGWKPTQGVNEVIRHFDPHVAVVKAGSSSTLAEAFIASGIPTIIYFHDVSFQTAGEMLTDHPLVSFVANSEFTASRVSEVFNVIATVIPPLVLKDRYETVTCRRKVVFIGLNPVKGVDLAFRLAETRKDIPFEFYESWSLGRKEFNDYRKRARCAGNVSVSRKVLDMRTVYRQAKIVLVPSSCEEAWGRVVTEAQHSGIPVLASKIGGLPESVGQGGILVDADAPLSTWQQALSLMWDDSRAYSEFVTQALRHSQRKEIQEAHIVQKLLDVFQVNTSR